jgi:hypothetical protein
MIPKSLLLALILLISTPNYPFFGPIIKFHFLNKIHSFTVNTDLNPEYTYQDLCLDIAIEFALPLRQIEAQDVNSHVYLNLDSHEPVKGLTVEKPLHLIITKRTTPNPKPAIKSLFDFLDDDLL